MLYGFTSSLFVNLWVKMFNIEVTASTQYTLIIQHAVSAQCTVSVLYTNEQPQSTIKLLTLTLQHNVLYCTVIFNIFLKL